MCFAKSCAGVHICQNDSECGNGSAHEYTALPLTLSWLPFPGVLSDSLPLGPPDRVLSELFKAALLCNKVLPAGKYISFSVPKDLEKGKHLPLCSTLAHMLRSQSLVSPTDYIPVLPQKQFAILLHLMHRLCKTCLANSNFPELTTSSTINLGKLCQTWPRQTFYLILK